MPKVARSFGFCNYFLPNIYLSDVRDLSSIGRYTGNHSNRLKCLKN